MDLYELIRRNNNRTEIVIIKSILDKIEKNLKFLKDNVESFEYIEFHRHINNIEVNLNDLKLKVNK